MDIFERGRPRAYDTDVFYLSENLHGHYFYYEDRFKEIKLEGYPLIIFRGEKVSGATNFVSSLQELDKIITTKKYIDCIVDCCIKLLPELEAKENEIVAYLDQLNMRIDTEKENCTNLENEISTLTDQKELEEHRDELKNLLKEKKEIYDELIKSYRTHYQYSVHIKKYKDDIDFYLKSIEAVMEPQE